MEPTQKEKFLSAMETISEGMSMLLHKHPELDKGTALSLAQFMWSLYCSDDTLPPRGVGGGPLTKQQMEAALRIQAVDPKIPYERAMVMAQVALGGSETITPPVDQHLAFNRDNAFVTESDPVMDFFKGSSSKTSEQTTKKQPK